MTASKESKSVSGNPEIQRSLTALDATSIIIGTIIGAAIFMLPSVIAGVTGDWKEFLAAWAIGGCLAFFGALCYAELSTTYSEDGGDYVYLKKSYGRYPAFLFAWVCGWIFRPANIAAMGITFATFFQQVVPAPVPEKWALLFWSLSAVSFLTTINLLGTRTGKWTQNILTFCKVGGLLVFCSLAFSWIWFGSEGSDQKPVPAKTSQTASQRKQDTPIDKSVGSDSNQQNAQAADPKTNPKASTKPAEDKSPIASWFAQYFMALVFVMYAFGGWNDIAFVAGEIKNPQKNLPISLMTGLAIVTVIYMLVNVGLIMNLGLEGISREGKHATSKVVELRSVGWGLETILPTLFNLMVGISCLGAIAAMLITSPRLFYAAAKDHQLFKAFGTWNHGVQSPTSAIVGQWAATVAMLLVVGGVANFLLEGDAGGKKPFDELVAVSSPFFWFFLGLVGLSVIVLRIKDPKTERPFRTWFYPVVPILFSITGFAMLYSSLSYAYASKFYFSGGIVLSVFAVGVIAGFFPASPSGDLDKPSVRK